jgi:hypothetical protein
MLSVVVSLLGVCPEPVRHENEWLGRPYQRRRRQIQVGGVSHIIEKLDVLKSSWGFRLLLRWTLLFVGCGAKQSNRCLSTFRTKSYLNFQVTLKMNPVHFSEKSVDVYQAIAWEVHWHVPRKRQWTNQAIAWEVHWHVPRKRQWTYQAIARRGRWHVHRKPC